MTAAEHELVEAIAQRVVELLEQRDSRSVQPAGLVSASELAGALGVSVGFVYDHAIELGAVRIGAGSKPRLRFDLNGAKAAVAPPPVGVDDASRQPRAARRRSSMQTATASELLGLGSGTRD